MMDAQALTGVGVIQALKEERPKAPEGELSGPRRF